MEGIGSLGRKTLKALKQEGVTGVARKTVSYIHTAKIRKQQLKYIGKIYKESKARPRYIIEEYKKEANN